MLITKVVLENIKSYRKATIAFAQGTTAIRGHNGAGKSTLVEAIGYALFDFLPYARQGQFVREGEKIGKVVVSFISAADSRAYEVERRCAVSGSGGVWFVVDPELHARVTEGRDDTLAFLRVHLGVDSTLPLGDLFDNAIAVQQGTFTADFLQTASVRKKKFDLLLQVEDYRKAADALRETASYLKDTMSGYDQTIERLKAQTADLPLWKATHKTLQTDREVLWETTTKLDREKTQMDQRLQEAVQARQDVMRLRNEHDQHLATWRNAQDQSKSADEAAARAAEAQIICAQSEAGHRDYLDVEQQLIVTQENERIANELQIKRAMTSEAIQAKRREIAAAAKRLSLAEDATRECARLDPLVAQQATLEEVLNRARLAKEALTRYESDRERFRADLIREQSILAGAQDEITQIEPRESLAALHDTRRADAQQLRDDLTVYAERFKQRASLDEQIVRQRQRVNEAQQVLTNTHQSLTQTRSLLDVVSRLPALEGKQAQSNQRLAQLRADIAQVDAARDASKGGMCPFLKEPCQNMARRGIVSLEDHFTDELIAKMAHLPPLESEVETITREVTLLQQHQAQVSLLPEMERQFAASQAALVDHQRELAQHERVHAELIDIEQGSVAREQSLALADAALKESAEARVLCARLPVLRSKRSDAQAKIDDLTHRLSECETAIITARESAGQSESLMTQLAALGDPRKQRLQREAESRGLEVIQSEIASHQVALDQAEANLTVIDRDLAPFADIDERIAALRARRATAAADHDAFLRHEHDASRLAEAQSLAIARRAQATAAEVTYIAAKVAYDAAIASYDPQLVETLTAQRDELTGETHRLSERLEETRRKISTLDAQIAEAETRLSALEATYAQRAEADGTMSLLAYCRDTIKEAGPKVMDALLRQISGEANRIFGEIMGDRAATLSWEDDYDIVLRSGAYARHFAQLSGGEQMSAALAMRLALLHTLTRATIAFFDEPTQNMDDERRANLAAQIRRVSGFDQLIVISHDDTFEEGLDAVVWVRKNDGESQVEGDADVLSPSMPSFAFPGMLGA